jgi:hypothetical protein
MLPAARVGRDRDVAVGPIAVHTSDTIRSLETKIKDELASYGIDVATISLRGYISTAMGFAREEDLDPTQPFDMLRLPENLNIFV